MGVGLGSFRAISCLSKCAQQSALDSHRAAEHRVTIEAKDMVRSLLQGFPHEVRETTVVML